VYGTVPVGSVCRERVALTSLCAAGARMRAGERYAYQEQRFHNPQVLRPFEVRISDSFGVRIVEKPAEKPSNLQAELAFCLFVLL
jgi:hypothetical protein